MYLNILHHLVLIQSVMVKPKHRMYLNSNRTAITTRKGHVKPKHRMYLNVIDNSQIERLDM